MIHQLRLGHGDHRPFSCGPVEKQRLARVQRETKQECHMHLISSICRMIIEHLSSAKMLQQSQFKELHNGEGQEVARVWHLHYSLLSIVYLK